ncbi:MAG: hypothetical protein KatS3mg057_1682 [Herpetosiphonaceae bacterium]|nr:MAG: hypothetical protein KatS3mg057_1682 [Herpetosiphonaceae bacterium]
MQQLRATCGGALVLREAGCFTLITAVALLLALLAYQAPVTGSVAVGGPLSRAFLGSSEAHSQSVVEHGLFYADELDADGGRSRWTRQRAVLQFKGLGETGPLALTLEAQGWPEDTIGTRESQPQVYVSANGQVHRQLHSLRRLGFLPVEHPGRGCLIRFDAAHRNIQCVYSHTQLPSGYQATWHQTALDRISSDRAATRPARAG